MTDNIIPSVGDSFLLECVVSEQKTASIFSGGENEVYADVLGTPFLIADMEKACAKLLASTLDQNQVSVGAHIDVRHIAPTGIGASYSVYATLIEKRWNLYTFEVVAKDSVGEIGKGRIVRAVVSLDDIMLRGSKAI